MPKPVYKPYFIRKEKQSFRSIETFCSISNERGLTIGQIEPQHFRLELEPMSKPAFYRVRDRLLEVEAYYKALSALPKDHPEYMPIRYVLVPNKQ